MFTNDERNRRQKRKNRHQQSKKKNHLQHSEWDFAAKTDAVAMDDIFMATNIQFSN